MTYRQVRNEWRKLLEVHETIYELQLCNQNMPGRQNIIRVVRDLMNILDGVLCIERTETYFRHFTVPSHLDKWDKFAVKVNVNLLKDDFETLCTSLDR